MGCVVITRRRKRYRRCLSADVKSANICDATSSVSFLYKFHLRHQLNQLRSMYGLIYKLFCDVYSNTDAQMFDFVTMYGLLIL